MGASTTTQEIVSGQQTSMQVQAAAAQINNQADDNPVAPTLPQPAIAAMLEEDTVADDAEVPSTANENAPETQNEE